MGFVNLKNEGNKPIAENSKIMPVKVLNKHEVQKDL